MAKKAKVIDMLTKREKEIPVEVKGDMIELPRAVVDELLRKAIMNKEEHTCSCGGSCGGNCGGNCKCNSQKKKLVNPVVEYQRGMVEGTVLFDRAKMSTGYHDYLLIDCNVIADDKTGALYVEVPDENGVCWHATLDRPCIVGSDLRPYGFFVPKNCGAEGLEGMGQAFIDLAKTANPQINIPFLEEGVELELELPDDGDYYNF